MMLRFPSCVFSSLSVLCVYGLGKRLFGRQAAVYAAVFTGFSPLHLWYAQEARDYSLILLWGLLASYFLVAALRNNRSICWGGFIFFSFAGICSSYWYSTLFGLHFFIAAFGLIKRKRKAQLAVLMLPVLSCAVFWSWARFKWQHEALYSWVPVPDVQSLIITLGNLVLGYHGTAPVYLAMNVVTCVLLFIAFRELRNKSSRGNILFCLALSAVPVILLYIFSRNAFPVYLDRGFLLFTPYLYFLLALGITRSPLFMRRSVVIIILALLLFGCYRYKKDEMSGQIRHHIGVHSKKPVRPINEYIKENFLSGDRVMFMNESLAASVIYYSGFDRRYSFLYAVDPRSIRYPLSRRLPEMVEFVYYKDILDLEWGRLWVIVSSWSRDGALDKHGRAVNGWLNDHLKVVSVREFDGEKVVLYERLLTKKSVGGRSGES